MHQTAARFRALMGEKGDFATVLFGAGLVLTIRFVAGAVGFASVILLARWMGSSEYGRYSFAIAWMNLLAYPATLGLPGAAVRFVAQYTAANDWRRAVGFMKVSAWLAFICGAAIATLGIGVVLVLRSHVDSQYVAPTVVALAGIPVVALIIVRAEAIRGLGWVGLAWGPLQLGQPLLLLLIAAAIWAIATELTATTVVGASIMAYVVCLVAQWGVLRARLGTRIRVEPKVHLRTWLLVARSFFWTSLASVILLQAGVIVVGFFLPPQDVAIYSAAAATSGLVALPQYAAGALGAPKFAALHAQRRRPELQALVTNIIRWTFWPSLVIGLIFVAFGSTVLRLFGPGFERGYAILLLLTLGQLASAFCGPVVGLLNMTGHQAVTARVLSTSAILGVALGFVFTPTWGTVGTAMSFSAVMVLWNVLLTIVVVRNLEIFPSVSRLLIQGRINRPPT